MDKFNKSVIETQKCDNSIETVIFIYQYTLKKVGQAIDKKYISALGIIFRLAVL